MAYPDNKIEEEHEVEAEVQLKVVVSEPHNLLLHLHDPLIRKKVPPP